MWHLDGSIAHLRTEQVAATIDLRQPHLGIHGLRLRSGEQWIELPGASLLRLRLPGGTTQEALLDSWVRGSDLVGVYAATSTRATHPELYWRYLSVPDAVGLELIISVHTGILDDDPGTCVDSTIQAVESWWLPASQPLESARKIFPDTGSPSGQPSRQHNLSAGPGSTIVKLDSQIAYLEMTHPADYCGVELAWRDGTVAVHTPLFPERLEKGVIRRGRLRAWFLPALDLAATRKLYREFQESDPPLTT